MLNQVNRQSGFRNVILLLLITGMATLLISPAFAGTGVTISADGSQSYYLGERVVLRGQSPDAGTVYLFMTGPNLPAAGGKLTSPDKAVVSGNPNSFTAVKTKPDKTWEYTYYTANLRLDAGLYSVFAVSQPKAMDQVDPAAANVKIILKKPFITAEIPSSTVVKGQPFSVTGTAEGIPAEVQLWILGDTYRVIAKEPVSANATFEYRASPEILANLPAGSYYLVAQHPMADNQFDVVVNGNYVHNLNLNKGTNVFSLQDSNVADVLITTIGDQEANKNKSARDTYTIVPFQITDTGNPGASAGTKVSGTGITISADGDKSYYMGEKVVLRGRSPDADTVYLFITGPTEVLPASGVKLTSSDKAVVSGNPDSFTIVKTKPDKTWEYSFYTANLINPDKVAGTYTIYAVNQPKAKDQLGSDAANVGIILKKPFITAEISSPNVVKGQPFSVTGTAEGIPGEVQVWIFGNNYVFTTKTPVSQNDASFTFTADATIRGKLPKGQNYLVVQHPMSDNQFDVVVNGDYVRNQKLNSGTNVFRITGPGSLQGGDAAEALIAAINEQEANDKTYTKDMYTLIQFQVTDA